MEFLERISLPKTYANDNDVAATNQAPLGATTPISGDVGDHV
jgi:hypothetical protein